jgi:hypothetical protein
MLIQLNGFWNLKIYDGATRREEVLEECRTTLLIKEFNGFLVDSGDSSHADEHGCHHE